MNNTTFDINTLTRENVKELKPYSSARDEYVSDGSAMIFLDANENPFENGVNRYPDPHQRKLKALLAAQKNVTTDQILFGNGSDEVLDLLFRAFCEPKQDSIISLPPTYGMYKVLSEINQIENKEVLLTKDFQLNVPEILSATNENTKIIFICSPNNPTGNSFAIDEIEILLKSFNGLIVIDEAYIDFSDQNSWISRMSQFPNLIVTQTLSKAYGLAGIRLGVCYASEEIIGVLKKIKPPYNVNELTQQKAFERVSNTEKIQEEIQQILNERETLEKELSVLPYVIKVYPSETNFILAMVDDANLRYEQLLKNGIVIRNRTTQPLCENTLRFTVGTKEENEKLIEVLKNIENQN